MKQIILTLLLTLTVQTRQIKVTYLNNSRGILPINLGETHIIINNGIFLLDLNLKELETFYKLIDNYKKLNISVTNNTFK